MCPRSLAAPLVVVALFVAGLVSPLSAQAAASAPGAAPSAGPLAPSPSQSTQSDSFTRAPRDLLLGVTLSPRGHTTTWTEADWVSQFVDNAPWGKLVGFHAQWRDTVFDDGEQPPLAVVGAASAELYGFVPTFGVGWTKNGLPDLRSESQPFNNTWTNVETREEFLQAVTDFAASAQPPYLFLGNETNLYWLTATPGQWAAWLSEYEACYDAIKRVSPDTMISTVFQYERMAGLGAHAGWSGPTHFELLDELIATGRVDALAFTSYPFLEHDTPADIPDDYYAPILERWDGPVFFTEIGWKAIPSFPYPGSEADQAAYVPRFFELVADLDVEYATWLFQHDWDGDHAEPVVRGIGFRSNDGSVVRLSDAAWRQAVFLHER